ncbi:uncharacterized protein DUF2786 [Rhodococcus sp. OK611]|uniref:DUF2786 domain-containing protein n=1 Tax=unclassified Rhodococcus (in: high G+C Gram-positive bacteria) TaxID=192944 RepID=UPI000BCCE443|nr:MULTISPECIES: DUF2786 domain-containing protein [unclassified Rhodococcus (in: high G+C Gram-positive bacteria)]PTR42880.1 uncharacterized protein DUF2786 [Rhodococcus sp. OK611]SNX91763.1 Protein of unknown function [Rhodococcus sp. OK270]
MTNEGVPDDGRPSAEAAALLDALSGAYERGWQPADLLHLTRRAAESPPGLAAAVLLYEARLSGAADRAPTEWSDQLHTVGEVYPDQARLADRTPVTGPRGGHLAGALTAGRSGFLGYQLSELAAEWNRLSDWMFLLPPPSQWPPEGAAEPEAVAAEPATTADPKVLGRIRGLLAKAERTEFAEEAEAFTAKAQELMTRYAITAALLRSRAHAGGTVVHSRRFHFENPYLKEKVHLLTAIGDANRVRTVLFGDLDIATAVGTPVDLQQVDLLFTSLLVQSARALQSGAAEGRSGARTTGFRKAFLAGFASRIGQRLHDADATATEAAAAEESIPLGDLLPVLATTSAAVDAEFTRLFPGTTKARARSVDARGWHAGRAAADNASLAKGERAIRRK